MRVSNTSENMSLIGEGGAVVFFGANGQDASMSGGVQAVLAVLMALLSLVTVMGNSLVTLAFTVDRNLRSQNNFFVLNLALCDFFVGAVCIPFYMPYLLTGKWMLGRFACKFWLITDYVMCVASSLSIALISYDRFLSVTMAMKYQAIQRNLSQAFLKMAMVWIVSFLMYGPVIVLWEHLAGVTYVPEYQCFSEFYNSWYFLVGASSVEFLLPLACILYFNFSICWNILKRSQKRSVKSQVTTNTMGSYTISGNLLVFSSQVKVNKNASTTTETKIYSFFPYKMKCFCIPVATAHSKAKDVLKVRCLPNEKLLRDMKVARSLAILVCVFVMCWGPYTLLMGICAACNRSCVHSYWYEITFWLMWLNSSINPFLYPLCHRDFRRAFKNILRFKRYTRSA